MTRPLRDEVPQRIYEPALGYSVYDKFHRHPWQARQFVPDPYACQPRTLPVKLGDVLHEVVKCPLLPS